MRHRRLPTDAVELRRLLHHEARVHASAHRAIRDLGDGILLIDPLDRDPSINRLVGPTWPAEPDAFDRRLDEVITLFATLDRRPHIWAATGRRAPDPTVDRLIASGFRLLGSAAYLRLLEPEPCRALAGLRPAVGVTVERLDPPRTGDRGLAAREIAWVVGDAFDLDPVFRVVIETDTLRSFGRSGTAHTLVRVGGEPAATVKRVTLDGLALLSSIGTRRPYRGRGLGRLATAVAAADALREGARLVYLAVEEENTAARRMYEPLGFEALDEVAAHLLLER